MSLFRKSSAAAMVLAASLFASNAQAAQTLIISGPSGIFGDDNVACAVASPCTFEREFTFTTPVGFDLASLTIGSIASSAASNIDFSSVTFNGVNFTNILTGDFESRFLVNQVLQPGALNRIFVSGTTGGSAAFSGDLSFAVGAIPEPTTWMLMLLGFGGIGFSLRRKQSARRVQFA